MIGAFITPSVASKSRGLEHDHRGHQSYGSGEHRGEHGAIAEVAERADERAISFDMDADVATTHRVACAPLKSAKITLDDPLPPHHAPDREDDFGKVLIGEPAGDHLLVLRRKRCAKERRDRLRHPRIERVRCLIDRHGIDPSLRLQPGAAARG